MFNFNMFLMKYARIQIILMFISVLFAFIMFSFGVYAIINNYTKEKEEDYTFPAYSIVLFFIMSVLSMFLANTRFYFVRKYPDLAELEAMLVGL